MRRTWRVPVLLSATVLLAQLAPQFPLLDVVTGTAPEGARLRYPPAHVVFAPLTLVADWLNGAAASDLGGFAIWSLTAYLLARLLVRKGETGVGREALYAILGLAALLGFVSWAALVPRPIPRLLVQDQDALVLDIHSHTSASHDGRAGFDPEANAAWHGRGGFDVAFVTDHNRLVARTRGRTAARGETARLLDGVELSLYGLHLLALGVTSEISNRGYHTSWDSSGAFIRRLAGDSGASTGPLLVASLPEYWRHHWGADLGDLAIWGVEGFEIWTTTPRAMDFPAALRRAVVARCRLSGLTMFGATGMHGFGHAATVWNLVRLPGWQMMSDSVLTAALLAHFRARGAEATQVLALRRWVPEAHWGRAASVPVNLALLLRTASPPHAAALLAWIWAPALLGRAVRRRAR